jgi:hypothetical protein
LEIGYDPARKKAGSITVVNHVIDDVTATITGSSTARTYFIVNGVSADA